MVVSSNVLTVPDTTIDKTTFVKSSRRIIAAVMLVTWLFASVHVMVAHGGRSLGSDGVAESLHEHHHHDGDGTDHHDTNHHHDLDVATASHFGKASDSLELTPQLLVEVHRWFTWAAVFLLSEPAGADDPGFEDPPPDARRSGWLFVSHTALPVRGPSLAA